MINSARIALFLPSIIFLASFGSAQGCSKTNLCATGCCSKYGYCGIGNDFCSPENCVSTCDYKGDNGSQCNEKEFCKIGCCSKFGVCGFGPDFCGSENCVSTCDRKAECDPGNFGSQYVNATNCPLNVCCSKYGFCGTTKDFCGTKKVIPPSCNTKTTTLARVVGYYEGWTVSRPCHKFWPENIPTGVYTHLNYAFASIHPETFEVVIKNHEIGVLNRLVNLKEKDPSLKVNIAIGGWTYNNPGPTATTFSDLARSEQNQQRFFRSLTSFLATYNLDGVDIDWEYPVADDRSGRPEDFKQFPKFLANLKAALASTGGRDQLSITIPASYWYLQHFDIVELEKYVTYFNFMTYDLHGEWDKGNKWTGNFLNAHTNLTEIGIAIDLLWRNNINPEKVVLGLGFYSRSFTVESTSCTTPGCLFASGSNPGPCSNEAGILLNGEIDDIIVEKKIQPKLDKDAAVQILTWGDQWAAYDDEGTLETKADFARSQCLGGVMVWAVSHDTPDAKYSLALNRVSNRPLALKLRLPDGSLEDRDKIQQCYWSGCRETCRQGYFSVSRSDPGARKGELMLDETACGGDGVRTFCCPQDSRLHDCGWYTHNNGRCDGKCPPGKVEVGSNSKYCRGFGLFGVTFQAACCNTDVPSMKLYTTSEWLPDTYDCDKEQCSESGKSQLLISSATGSGGSLCKITEDGDYEKRKLCYDDSVNDRKWDKCEWFTSKGNIPAGKGPDYCRSSCPDDTIRVAMDVLKDECRGKGGAASYCCIPGYFEKPKSREDHFREDLDLFLKTPDCWGNLFADAAEKGSLSKLSASTVIPNRKLQASIQRIVIELTSIVTAFRLNPEEIKILSVWNEKVRNRFPGVAKQKFIDIIVNSIYTEHASNSKYAVSLAVCQLEESNAIVEDMDHPNCKAVNLCILGEEYCEPKEDGGRLSRVIEPHGQLSEKDAESLHRIDKRWIPDTKSVILRGRNSVWYGLGIQPAEYPSATEWRAGSFILSGALNYLDEADCSNPAVNRENAAPIGNYHTEHIIELQTIPMFFEFLNTGRLPSGKMVNILLYREDIMEIFFTGYLRNEPSLVLSGSTSDFPYERIMDALGSNSNDWNFELLRREINGRKTMVWDIDDFPVKEDNDGYFTEPLKYATGLSLIRNTISVWAYFQESGVNTKRQYIILNVWKVLSLIKTKIRPRYNIDLPNLWEMFIQDKMEQMTEKSINWVDEKIRTMHEIWIPMASGGNALAIMIVAKLNILNDHKLNYVRIPDFVVVR